MLDVTRHPLTAVRLALASGPAVTSPCPEAFGAERTATVARTEPLTYEERQTARRLVSERTRELSYEEMYDRLDQELERVAAEKAARQKPGKPWVDRKIEHVVAEHVEDDVEGRAFLYACLAGDATEAFGLSTREGQVLALTAEGLSNLEIGERLSLAPETIKRYVGNVLAKMGARNRAHAVAIGLECSPRSGVTEPPAAA
jgi:DNA-binding CsgD family transcriptional regulator